MAPLVRTGGSRHTGLAAPPHRNIQQIIMLFTPDEYSDSVKNMYESIANMRELKLSADEKYVEGIES